MQSARNKIGFYLHIFCLKTCSERILLIEMNALKKLSSILKYNYNAFKAFPSTVFILYHYCFHSSYLSVSFAILYLESNDLYSTQDVTDNIISW